MFKASHFVALLFNQHIIFISNLMQFFSFLNKYEECGAITIRAKCFDMPSWGEEGCTWKVYLKLGAAIFRKHIV